MRLALVRKTIRDRWKNLLGWSLAMFALTSIQLYIYPTIEKTADAMDQFIKAFPKELIAMFRIEDYTSATGFLGTELFSMMIPLVFIAIGSSWAASAAAEEEERGTSEIIYALPISRTSVLLSKVVSAWLILAAITALEFVILSIGSPLVGLDLEGVELIPGLASCLGLGMFFHGLALLLGSITGKRGVALGAAIGIGLISFLVFSLAPLVDTFDSVLPFIPFEWALGNSPLTDGFDWLGLTFLLSGTVLTTLASLVAINSRDLDA